MNHTELLSFLGQIEDTLTECGHTVDTSLRSDKPSFEFMAGFQMGTIDSVIQQIANFRRNIEKG